MVRRELRPESARDVPECKSTQGLKRGCSKPSGPVIDGSRQSGGVRIDGWRDGDKNDSLLGVKQGESSFSPAPQCNNREGHISWLGLSREWAGRCTRLCTYTSVPGSSSPQPRAEQIRADQSIARFVCAGSRQEDTRPRRSDRVWRFEFTSPYTLPPTPQGRSVRRAGPRQAGMALCG